MEQSQCSLRMLAWGMVQAAQHTLMKREGWQTACHMGRRKRFMMLSTWLRCSSVISCRAYDICTAAAPHQHTCV